MKKLWIALLLTCAPVVLSAQGVAVSVRNGTTDPGSCQPQGTNIFINRLSTPVLKICQSDGVWDSLLSTSAAVGLYAPIGATYITQTSNAALTNEQALAALTTGIMKVTTATGAVTTAVAGDFPTLNQNTTGTAAALTTARTINGDSFDGTGNIQNTLASADFANQGTLTTVYHGAAAGNPSFGAVVSADMNITTTTCTSQVVTAISAGGVGTCSGITGSWVTAGTIATARGGTNIDTSGSTGVPTIAAGTWSVSTSPALGTPTATTIQTSGNVGIGGAPSGVAGVMLTLTDNANRASYINMTNPNTGASADARTYVSASTAQAYFACHSSGYTGTNWGLANLANWCETYSVAGGGNGLVVGTAAGPVHLGTANLIGLTVDGTTQAITLPKIALTAGAMAAVGESVLSVGQTCRSWTNAQVTALPTTAGDIAFGTLPANYVVRNAYIKITGAAVGPTTVTVSLGRTSATYIDYTVASDAKAAANTVYGDASGERGTNMTGYDLPSVTGTTVVNAHFASTGANLSTVTGSTGTVCVFTEKVMW